MSLRSLSSLSAALLCALCVAGCAHGPAAGFAPSRGFIPEAELPDAVAFLPPPPADGSAAKAWDLARHELAKKQREDPARAALAARDAVFTWENLYASFSPAYGRTMSEAETPALCALLHFALDTTRQSYRRAKRTYRRPRPFAELGEPPLRPEDVRLGADSYPSGHAATAWAAALVLCEVRPANAEGLLARAFEAGESRLVCGVHWASDVEAGRLVAGAAVARMHADPDFRGLLEAALREEVALPQAPGPSAKPVDNEMAL
ncbi:MAG: phosphatase PAP2 family protein [Kiritimatiellae bacterium]|nr:phosphatase PAP2 family protein [Kiritimatiellia bacterium]